MYTIYHSRIRDLHTDELQTLRKSTDVPHGAGPVLRHHRPHEQACPMAHAKVDVALGLDARLGELSGIRDALVTQRVQLVHGQHVRWETLQIGGRGVVGPGEWVGLIGGFGGVEVGLEGRVCVKRQFGGLA